MYRIISIGILVIFLVFGCRVKENEVSFSVKDLNKAISGETVSVDFEAEIRIPMTMEQVSQKFQLKEVQKVLESYLDLEDYEIEKGEIMGTKISLEGTLPMLLSKENNSVKVSGKSPWAIAIIPIKKASNDLFSKYDFKVTLATTEHFLKMNKDLQAINFMLGTEETQPMKIKLKNKKGTELYLFAGPVEYEGKMVQYFQKSTKDTKLTFLMKAGIYNFVQPSFLIKISN